MSADEGLRATTLESLQGLKTVIEGGTITAGNASQLSDGSSAQLVMDAKVAAAGRAWSLWVSIAVSRWPVARPMKWA